jgi:hypothetical protein
MGTYMYIYVCKVMIYELVQLLNESPCNSALRLVSVSPLSNYNLNGLDGTGPHLAKFPNQFLYQIASQRSTPC